MRYVPFQLKNFPYIAEDLSTVAVDLAIARLGKNAIRLDDRVIFSANYAEGMKSVEVPLDEEGYKKANLSVAEKMCLRRILDLLEQADVNDEKIVARRYSSQFEVTRAIRGLDQNYGGGRFVLLARDIIDGHMGSCLYPYMVGDLVLSVYLAYNKNVNRDVAGFMSGIVDFAADFVEKEGDLQTLFDQIEEKSSENLYLEFLKYGLRNEKLRKPLADSVVRLFTHHDEYRVNYAEAVPPEFAVSFPKETLIQFFEKVAPRFEKTVAALFQFFGKDCDPDYLYAYQRNPGYDTRILSQSPAFGLLDPHKVDELKLREWVFKQKDGKQIVARFRELADEASKQQYLRVCIDAGWADIAHALNGEVFSTRSMDFDTFYVLLPYMNLDFEQNRLQAISYVRNVLDYNPTGVNKLLLALHHPAFTDIVRDALKKQKVTQFPIQVLLADRFHCPDAIDIKEWH